MINLQKSVHIYCIQLDKFGDNNTSVKSSPHLCHKYVPHFQVFSCFLHHILLLFSLMFKYRYFQEFSFQTFVLSLLYTHVLDSLIHLMFLKAIFSKMCNPMIPIFISIALTLLLNTKLVTSAAYLTLLLGCLLCITN